MEIDGICIPVHDVGINSFEGEETSPDKVVVKTAGTWTFLSDYPAVIRKRHELKQGTTVLEAMKFYEADLKKKGWTAPHEIGDFVFEVIVIDEDRKIIEFCIGS